MNKPIRVVEGNAKPFESFWQVRDAAQTGGEPEIDFIGYISEYSWMGDEVTPKKFKADLYEVGKGGPVTIRMHSGGGEIFAASAIRAILDQYPGDKTVCIDGLCASAAVAIALAGNKVKIYDTAYMMIHNPGYAGLFGYLDAETLQKFSDELRIFKDGLLNAYESRTKIARDVLSAMLDAETWMTAQRAVELGFADEVITGGGQIKTDVTKDVINYVNVPAALLAQADDVNDNNGQESVADDDVTENPMQAHLERVAKVKEFILQGEQPMNIRELLKDRSEKVARAEALTQLCDAEARDFTEEERAEFDSALTDVEALDARIEKIQTERARLTALTSKKFEVDAERPAPEPKTSMKRSEFNALNASAQAAFVRGGGKIQD